MSKFEHTILVVDDEMLNITALTHLLSDEFEVITERSGRKSIQVARDTQPDVILLDVVMPDMNGFEVITELKKDELTKNIPVIFVTGLNNTRDEEQGFMLGAVDYINKPFSRYIVKLRIKNQLKISEQVKTISELSKADPLTGVVTKKTFLNVIDGEWRRASRTGSPLGMAMFGIDGIAQYNEKYGIQKGDDALLRLSQIIFATAQRSGGKVARWDGDRFVMILAAADSKEVSKIADDIRQKIEKETITDDGIFASGITVSVGTHFTVPLPQGVYTMENLIMDTAAALSYAKKSGRNKVSTFEEAKEMI